MECSFRCSCPITSAIDIVGDKWTLVIIKQMLVEGKRTFKDFTESDEAIASNILSSRLKMLESFEIIKKEKLPDNKKTNLYILTEKGLSLIPVVVELTLWGDKNLRTQHPNMYSGVELELMKSENKEKVFVAIKENYNKSVSELFA